MYIINVADLDAGDGTGRSYRQVNNETSHSIPIGTLVEYNSDSEYHTDMDGVRLFVVRHGRDCDGTPLYDLCATRYPSENDLFFKTHNCFGIDSLTIIRLPSEGR